MSKLKPTGRQFPCINCGGMAKEYTEHSVYRTYDGAIREIRDDRSCYCPNPNCQHQNGWTGSAQWKAIEDSMYELVNPQWVKVDSKRRTTNEP